LFFWRQTKPDLLGEIRDEDAKVVSPRKLDAGEHQKGFDIFFNTLLGM